MAFNGLGQQNGTPGFSQASRQDARIVSRSVLPPGVHSVRLHAEPIQSDTASRGTFLAMRLLTGADGVTGSLGERLAALGYSEDQCRLMASLAGSRGLTLLAGPTGHGKSTTLRHVMESMVIYRPDQSYLSVEDPPEYPMAGVRQIQVPTSGGDRASAYADAIGPSAMGGVRLRNPDGCPACGGQGILSRAAAAEIVDCRGAVGRLLARGEDGAARELWKRNGGVTIAGRCLGLIAKGLLDPVTCGHRLGGLSDPDSV